MKRKRLVIISISFLATVILGALLWPREREPEYNGVPLSGWLKASENFHSAMLGIPAKNSPYPNYPVDGSKSDVAIRHIGTNALPFLVRGIQNKSTLWQSCRLRFVRYFPNGPLKRRWEKRLYDEENQAEGHADAAIFAFAYLGPTATPALPELHRLAHSSDSDTSRRALACIEFITNSIAFNAPPQK